MFARGQLPGRSWDFAKTKPNQLNRAIRVSFDVVFHTEFKYDCIVKNSILHQKSPILNYFVSFSIRLCFESSAVFEGVFSDRIKIITLGDEINTILHDLKNPICSIRLPGLLCSPIRQ